ERTDARAMGDEGMVRLDSEPGPGPGPAVVRPVGIDIKETLKGKKAQQLTGRSEAERNRHLYFWEVPDTGKNANEIQLLKESKVTVQALAYEYIVYDRNVEGRWRELKVADLHSGHLDVGVDVNPRELPRGWTPMDTFFEPGVDPRDSLTVEEARFYNARWFPLDKREIAVKERLEKALRKIDELLEDPKMERKLARRKHPGDVRYVT